MDKLAQKYIENHNNPLVKIESCSNKRALNEKTKEEQTETNKYIEGIKTALNYDRVDKRSARCIGLWLPNQELIKITKSIGAVITHLGYQDKTGKYLYPDEALYLLEINKLELRVDDVPISIQQGYEILLNKNTPLKKYLVYKKLVSQGYRLLRKLKENPKPAVKKLKIDNDGCVENVINETDESGESESDWDVGCSSSYPSIDYDSVYEKLREVGPKSTVNSIIKQPDYFMFIPANKTQNPDFNLFIVNEFVDLKYDDTPSLLALCTEDQFIGFYYCNAVNVPIL